MRLSAHGVNTALLTTKTNVSASEFTTLRRYTNLFIVIIIIIIFFWPRYSIPKERKNYAMQYKKVQKSSWLAEFVNEVNARRARLQLGWVTVFGRVYHLGL